MNFKNKLNTYSTCHDFIQDHLEELEASEFMQKRLLENLSCNNKENVGSGSIDITKVVSLPKYSGKTWMEAYKDIVLKNGQNYSTEFDCSNNSSLFKLSYFESSIEKKISWPNLKNTKWIALKNNNEVHIIDGTHRTILAWILHHMGLINHMIPIHELTRVCMEE